MALFLKKGRIGEAAREGSEVPTPVWGWHGVRDKRKKCCGYRVGCVGLLDEGRGKRGREREKGKERKREYEYKGESQGVPETLQQRYPALPRSTPSRNSQPRCIQS